MSDQIQNTLESTLPALKHLLDTHKLTKQQVSKIMERRKLMLHRPFTKDNALRFLEYESKLDMYLKHKDSYNTFLDVLYKRVICKFRDEAVFTMFVKHLIGERIVCDDEGDKKSNRSFDVNRARYVDKYSLNTLKTFCLTYLKRNRTQYLTLLMANTFYKIGDVNTGRKLFVDAMRLSTDKSITKMMMECEQACHSMYQTTSSKEIIEALRKELEYRPINRSLNSLLVQKRPNKLDCSHKACFSLFNNGTLFNVDMRSIHFYIHISKATSKYSCTAKYLF